MRKKFKDLVEKIKKLTGEERLKYLVARIKELDDIDVEYDGESLLSAAVQNPDDKSNVEIMKILMENGADIHKECVYGSILKCAIDYNHNNMETIKYILNYIQDPSPLFSLKMICRDSFIKILEAYVKAGFDINYCDILHGTILMFAFEHQRYYLLEPLLQLGADINRPDMDGRSLLLLLIEHGNNEIIQKILDNGADINFVNSKNGTSILMLLVRGEHCKEMKILKNNNFTTLNTINSLGYSVLHYSLLNVHDENAEMLQVLLQKGADPEIISLKFIFESLPSHPLDTVPSVRKIMMLLKYGWNVPNTNNFYEKILRKFIARNEPEVFTLVKILLKRDDVDINYFYGEYTLLYKAISRKNIAMAKLLLNYGANYLTMCSMERTSVGKCFKCSSIGKLDTRNMEHMKIYELIQKIEFDKRYMKNIVLKDIRMASGEFTLNPTSIHSQTLAIKWELNKTEEVGVFNKLEKEQSRLLAYYGIYDDDTLRIKIIDGLKHS